MRYLIVIKPKGEAEVCFPINIIGYKLAEWYVAGLEDGFSFAGKSKPETEILPVQGPLTLITSILEAQYNG